VISVKELQIILQSSEGESHSLELEAAGTVSCALRLRTMNYMNYLSPPPSRSLSSEGVTLPGETRQIWQKRPQREPFSWRSKACCHDSILCFTTLSG